MSQPHSKEYKARMSVYAQNQELRELAREFKQTYYIPISACRKNHERKKFVSNDHCVTCTNINKLNYRNTEKGKKKEAEYGAKVGKKNRAKNRASVYGLSAEQIEEMKIRQNFKCAICENKFETERLTHVDHCHKTKKVRDLLCHSCNLGLGHFKDNDELMQKAIDYIKRHKTGCPDWNAI